MPSLRIVYGTGATAHRRRALALDRRSPGDFDVTVAPWPGGPDLEVLGAVEPDIVLCIPHDPAAGLLARARERGWRSKFVSLWCSRWPERLAELMSAYRSCDALVFMDNAYREATGRLPNTIALPDENAPRGAGEQVRRRRGPGLFEFLRSQLTGECVHDKPAPLDYRRDLSSKVTVFIRERDLEDNALWFRQLLHQTCRYRLEPLSRAEGGLRFEHMLARCQTLFFIPVHRRMILDSHAVGHLYEGIARAEGQPSMLAGALHDLRSGEVVDGTRIYRCNALHRYGSQPPAGRRAGLPDWKGSIMLTSPRDQSGRISAPPVGLLGEPGSLASVHGSYGAAYPVPQADRARADWVRASAARALAGVLDHGREAEYLALMDLVARRLCSGRGIATDQSGGEETDVRRDRARSIYRALASTARDAQPLKASSERSADQLGGD